MREIKFRAWNGEKIYLPSDSDTYFKLVFGELRSPGIILMQYTGLKDKNGKEIYEGDIITSMYERKPMPVEWIEHGFWCVREDGEHVMPYVKAMEVIGNIYENRDLLEGK